MARTLVIFALAVALAVAPAAAAPKQPANGCPLPCSGQVASPPNEQLLFVQPAGESGPLVAYDTATGKRRFALPAGRTSADGRWHLSASARGGSTTLARHRVDTGRRISAWSVGGRWSLEAVSPSGRVIALAARTGARTAVRVVDVAGRRVVQTLSLRGRFEIETLSSDGKRMFLIQHFAPRARGAPRYAVRLYDLTKRLLVTRPLRGKGEPAVMAGYAWSGVASPDGRWLLTLYLDTARRVAFVHSLDLVRSRPTCIFLPSLGGFERLKRYSLTLSPDGRRLFAANPVLGAVAEIDLARQRVARSVRFPASAAVDSPRAAGLSGTVSRDGRTLYFSAGRDLWAYDVPRGRVRGPYATGGSLLGYGFGSSDRRVFALRTDGRMLAFEAATGRRL